MVQLLICGLLVASLLNSCMESQFYKEEMKLVSQSFFSTLIIGYRIDDFTTFCITFWLIL